MFINKCFHQEKPNKNLYKSGLGFLSVLFEVNKSFLRIENYFWGSVDFAFEVFVKEIFDWLFLFLGDFSNWYCGEYSKCTDIRWLFLLSYCCFGETVPYFSTRLICKCMINHTWLYAWVTHCVGVKIDLHTYVCVLWYAVLLNILIVLYNSFHIIIITVLFFDIDTILD